MIGKSSDVVIEYDKKEKTISIVSRVGGKPLAGFSTFKVGDLGVDDLIFSVGESVIAFINLIYPGEIIGVASVDEVGSEVSEFFLIRARISNIGESSSLQDIDEIDLSLKSLSDMGDEAASDYFHNGWPKLKSVLVRRIIRERE